MATRSGTVIQGVPRGQAGLPGGGLLRRGLTVLAGLALAGLAAALLLACLGYQPGDPSWNISTAGTAKNPLGPAGAATADLSLQNLGLAAYLLPLPLIGWAWRLLRDRRLHGWWLRLLLLPVAVLAAATAFAPLARPASWTLEAGLGGALGDLLLGAATAALDLQRAPVAAAAAFLGTLAFVYALAVTRGEWRAVGRGAARALVAFRRRDAEAAGAESPQAPKRRKAKAGPRREPQLDGRKSDQSGKAPVLVADKARTTQGKRGREAAQGRLDLGSTGDYELPTLDLLAIPRHARRESELNRDALEKNARLLESVLEDFGVKGEIVKIRPGPVVTRYELEPAPGTKTSRVVGLADDIARSMSAVSVRVAVVPGSSSIGIELPNTQRETVYLRELLGSESFDRNGGRLPLVLGKDISGAPIIVDLSRMPHLLIAGTTGSGKSVSINVLILSLLYRLSPDQCRMIMIDPKMLELSVYEGIPHLLTPVVTEPKKAVVALKWTVREMEERYRNMSRLGVRNIDGYNARIAQAQHSGEVLTRRVQTGFDPETGQPITEEEPFDLEALPQIVVVVDEMADLMLVAGKEIETAVQRLSQMARAAGIHLIMATQRPSVDVITGTIKANFPTRISFHVTSKIDSRTILGDMGAEQLLGKGDMLYMAQGGHVTRVHGPWVTDREVEVVVNHLKRQGRPAYVEAVTEEEEPAFDGPDGGGTGDELYDKAVAVVCQHGKASTSFVQRHLQIGYNRAARIIEKMEAEGIVSPANHVGKREVLVQGPGDI
jgi:S-DNA-T family DNA segregation ATPase FtsK/SpoIIIE